MHGQFVWYELTTPDVDAAKKFYPQITGWGTQQFDNDYTMWTTRGVPFAGIFRLGEEQRRKGIPPNWMPYVDVDSVDETARKAQFLGGKVKHGPQEIPGTGRFAVLQDPQGATFGVYKSNKSSQAWDGTPIVGRFSWHELMTTDYRKAFEFYRQLFGWQKEGELQSPVGPYVMYGMKGKRYGGMYNRPANMASMQPFWLLYVNVPDVKKAADLVTKSGGFIQQPPMVVPGETGGMIAVFGDAQGVGFAVHQTGPGAPKAAAPPATATRKAPPRSKTKAAAKPKSRSAATKAPAAKKKSAAKKATRKKAKAKRR